MSKANIQSHSDLAHRVVSFIKAFFPKEENDTPDFHYDIYNKVALKREKQLVEAFRGSAKTTLLSKYLPLYAAVFGDVDKDIGGLDVLLFITDTASQAEDNIREVKDAYEDADPSLRAILKPSKVWRSDELEFVNANGYKFNYVTRAYGQKVRGLKRRGRRPNWLISDDLENDEAVLNENSRKKLKMWFFNAVIPALHPTKRRIFFVGTPLHHDALLMNLKNDPSWNAYSIPIQKEDGTPAWPDRFPFWWINEKKEEMRQQGILSSFYQEYMLTIIADEEAIFTADMFRYMEKKDLPEDLEYYVTVDLAISDAKTADNTAIVVVGIDVANNLYVVNMKVGKIPPSEQVKSILQFCDMYYTNRNGCVTLGVELVSYQKAFKEIFEREAMKRSDIRHKIPKITELKPDAKKERRIQRLEPLFRQKAIYFVASKETKMLEEELLMFPRAKHDDISDALAYIVQIMRYREGASESIIDHYNKDSIMETLGVSW